MDKIIVQGGNTRLSGEVVIEGAKNAVLPLLAATILASEGQTTLTNVPILSDVYTMNNVVRGLDIAVDFDEENNTVVVDARGEILDQAPYAYVSKMRADGVTTIENAAREPEIVDLALLLNEMGADVKGAGTETLVIKGVKSLHGTQHAVVQDRIEAGTFMVAAAMTSGDILIKDAIWEHNRPLISKLLEMGVDVKEEEGGIRVTSDVSKLKPVTVKTLPHPGFPTDMQAQFTALMAVVKGESTMIETVFENRFQHLEEMRRMGLHSEILRDTAMIHGGLPLQGAQVMSTDLRASAALILTGMVAEGTTTVGKLTHLDRGYYQFHEKLAKLGANISRVSEG